MDPHQEVGNYVNVEVGNYLNAPTLMLGNYLNADTLRGPSDAGGPLPQIHLTSGGSSRDVTRPRERATRGPAGS